MTYRAFIAILPHQLNFMSTLLRNTSSFVKALEVVDNFDYIICDIWGVINSCGVAIKGSLDFLLQIEKMGKKLIFLSNAPRRSAKVVDLLLSLGVPRRLCQVATSGEFFHQVMSGSIADDSSQQWYQEVGKLCGKCFAIGRLDDIELMKDLDVSLSSAQDANWLALFDLSGSGQDIAEIMHDLEICAANNLPAVCLKPDITTVGTAQRYRALGGSVYYFGKPYTAIYDWAIKDWNIAEKAKMMAIGDAMETDIKGAISFGIASILVMTGIHSGQYEFVNSEITKLQAANKNIPIFICNSLA